MPKNIGNAKQNCIRYAYIILQIKETSVFEW